VFLADAEGEGTHDPMTQRRHPAQRLGDRWDLKLRPIQRGLDENVDVLG
jgi:hypothetical protein